MAKESAIGWTTHTASPWFGCTEVDPCCANCYARELTEQKFAFMNPTTGAAGIMRQAYKRAGFADWATRPVWGDKATRVLSKGFWKDVLKWNREAGVSQTEAHGVGLNPDNYRPRIFTSLMDWLDRMPFGIIDQEGKVYDRAKVLGRFLAVIRDTPNLDWLLLTKRPENCMADLLQVVRVNHDGVDEWVSQWLDGDFPANVWFGYTAGTKREWIDRHAISREIPAKVIWCSAEPLLEPLDYADILRDPECPSSHNLDWIVIGGESGPKRRDIGVEPLVTLARQAKHHGTRVYVKQDAGLLPGTQGRIPDDVWALKEFPQ